MKNYMMISQISNFQPVLQILVRPNPQNPFFDQRGSSLLAIKAVRTY